MAPFIKGGTSKSYIHFLSYDLFICMCSDMCMRMYLHKGMLMGVQVCRCAGVQVPLPVHTQRSKVLIGFLGAGVTKACGMSGLSRDCLSRNCGSTL